MDSEGHLAVTDLLNHLYCPRITWFSFVLGLRPRGTIKTEHGRRVHEEWTRRRRAERNEGHGPSPRLEFLSQEVISRRLGLRGRMDAMATEEGTLLPYEVKSTTTPARPYPGHLLQLAAYALLLEERTGQRVDRGYLHYLGDGGVHEVEITEEAKRQVRGVMESLRQVVETEEMPPRAPASHCRDCGYRKICV
ncbi:MAG TPA: CRISPR-associated protein Cas4 [Candidatus Dormibacteraeota bacterium]|nr:CRISPR-associated protein Cas4 [Candidatus Dormibacteraeota bacterium]